METVADVAKLARGGATVVVMTEHWRVGREILDRLARTEGVVRVSFGNGTERVTYASGGTIRFMSSDDRLVLGLTVDYLFEVGDLVTAPVARYLSSTGAQIHTLLV